MKAVQVWNAADRDRQAELLPRSTSTPRWPAREEALITPSKARLRRTLSCRPCESRWQQTSWSASPGGRRRAHRRGHEPIPHGALADAERDDWAWASEAAARDVAEGRAEQAIVCCWTGTGASIAANKVPGSGRRSAGTLRRPPGRGSWNDANVLALSLRVTSDAELGEILDAWFDAEPSARGDDRANIGHLAEIEPCAACAVRRLHPRSGPDHGRRPARDLDLVAEPPDDRPYVITNFALTLDGTATLHGRSGAIGSDTDTAMLVGLRTKVDAVMIGAGTMRAERYGRVVADPDKRARREREGLPHDPLMVIVSGRLDLPWDAPLFTDGGGRGSDLHHLGRRAAGDGDPGSGRPPRAPVDLAEALAHLRSERGVRALLCEGGPRLHAQLHRRGPGRRAVRDPRAEARRRRRARASSSASPRPSARSSSPGSFEERGELFARYRTGAERHRRRAPRSRRPRRRGSAPRSTRSSPRRSIRRARIVRAEESPTAQAQLDAEDALATSSRRRGGRAAGPPRRRSGPIPAPNGTASACSSRGSSVTRAAVPEPKATRIPGTKWWMWRPPSRTLPDGHQPPRMPAVESRTARRRRRIRTAG